MTDRWHELTSLLESAGPRLFALLTQLTLREDVAEELLQELFIRLSRSAGFARSESREAYVVRSAINLAFDWRRKQKRALRPASLTTDVPSTASSPLTTLINREELEQVLDAANRLNTVRREVFILRYVQQESYEVIAERLGRTPHQVRGLGHKAVQQIRKQLSSGSDRSVSKEASHG